MDALPLLAALGVVSGLVAGAVIILFRFLIELSQTALLGLDDPEAYETLSMAARFLIPAAGGLLIGLIFSRVKKHFTQVGVVHVYERLVSHQGHMPWQNFFLQFIGALISIASGHSVGREGPGIHLGAASSSFIAQGLKLPDNTIRILVGCGAAASIAASFNTPIAGVIFAMEVILMEYTLAGFTPIILATVTATALTHLVYGDSPAFIVPPLELSSTYEIPILLVMGVVMGALSAAFIVMIKRTTQISQRLSILTRMTLAGVITGICAMLVPEIMGIGYDTVNAALLGELGLGLLAIIVLFKFLATTLGIGLGLPGGLIGPVANMFDPGDVASAGVYAMIGMGAMMGATLQAPLAALMALLELTINSNIILPGMLVVIIAGLTSSHLFKQQGIFLTLLRARGLDIRHDAIAQSLRRHGVASAMSRAYICVERKITADQAQDILRKKFHWIVIQKDGKPDAIMPTTELELLLNMEVDNSNQENTGQGIIDLMEIPGKRLDCTPVSKRATLHQALETMDEHNMDAVYISGDVEDGDHMIQGLITRRMLELYYRN